MTRWRSLARTAPHAGQLGPQSPRQAARPCYLASPAGNVPSTKLCFGLKCSPSRGSGPADGEASRSMPAGGSPPDSDVPHRGHAYPTWGKVKHCDKFRGSKEFLSARNSQLLNWLLDSVPLGAFRRGFDHYTTAALQTRARITRRQREVCSHAHFRHSSSQHEKAVIRPPGRHGRAAHWRHLNVRPSCFWPGKTSASSRTTSR